MQAKMGLRAYAKHRGVTHQAVRKAIGSGRISALPDGKIDPERADVQWQQRTRAYAPRRDAQPPGIVERDPMKAARVFQERDAEAVFNMKPVHGLDYDTEILFWDIGLRLRDRLAKESDPLRCECLVNLEVGFCLGELSKFLQHK